MDSRLGVLPCLPLRRCRWLKVVLDELVRYAAHGALFVGVSAVLCNGADVAALRKPVLDVANLVRPPPRAAYGQCRLCDAPMAQRVIVKSVDDGVADGFRCHDDPA